MNIQPIEKRCWHDGSELEVHSIFRTLQGEGPFSGRSALFIRLAGCNLQCPSCDTDYTSNRWEQATPKEIIAVLRELCRKTKFVVITGGEPFRQNIGPLVRELILARYTVQIETNGTLPPPKQVELFCSKNTSEENKCFIVCSPKTGRINPQLEPFICAFKYVMAYDSVNFDGLPILALDHTATPCVARPSDKFNGKIYIQPCDDKDAVINAANTKACVTSAMENGYILQLQIHKLLGVE